MGLPLRMDLARYFGTREGRAAGAAGFVSQWATCQAITCSTQYLEDDDHDNGFAQQAGIIAGAENPEREETEQDKEGGCPVCCQRDLESTGDQQRQHQRCEADEEQEEAVGSRQFTRNPGRTG
ncbi:hypothetical protein D3C81_1607840 [compost metagenome]